MNETIIKVLEIFKECVDEATMLNGNIDAGLLQRAITKQLERYYIRRTLEE